MSKIIQHRKDIVLPTNRIEALTDGVFAIAMTLLVLDIALPELASISAPAELTRKLLELSPKFFSYALSFVILGMLWHMHHTIFNFIKRLDSGLIWINTFLLLFVALIPFSTSIISEYDIASMGNVPFVLYVLNLLLIIIMGLIIVTYAAGHNRLVDSDIDSRILGRMRLVRIIAALVFALAIGVSFVSIIAAFCVLPLMFIFGSLGQRFIVGIK